LFQLEWSICLQKCHGCQRFETIHYGLNSNPGWLLDQSLFYKMKCQKIKILNDSCPFEVYQVALKSHHSWTFVSQRDQGACQSLFALQ